MLLSTLRSQVKQELSREANELIAANRESLTTHSSLTREEKRNPQLKLQYQITKSSLSSINNNNNKRSTIPLVEHLPKYGTYVTLRDNVPVEDDIYLRFVPYYNDDNTYSFFEAVYEQNQVDTQDERVVIALAAYEFDDLVLEKYLEEHLQLSQSEYETLKKIFDAEKQQPHNIDLQRRGISETFEERLKRCANNVGKNELPFGLHTLHPTAKDKPEPAMLLTTETIPVVNPLEGLTIIIPSPTPPLPSSKITSSTGIHDTTNIPRPNTSSSVMSNSSIASNSSSSSNNSDSMDIVIDIGNSNPRSSSRSSNTSIELITTPTTITTTNNEPIEAFKSLRKAEYEVMDTWRTLFCRLCYKFDCAHHPRHDTNEDYTLHVLETQVQTILSSPQWLMEDTSVVEACSGECYRHQIIPTTPSLTQHQKIIWTKTVIACHGSCCKASKILKNSCQEIRHIVQEQFHIIMSNTNSGETNMFSRLRNLSSGKLGGKNKVPTFALATSGFPPITTTTRLCRLLSNNYRAHQKIYINSKVAKKMLSNVLHGILNEPAVLPCEHVGPCSEENKCSCVTTGNYCTKHCSCCMDLNFGRVDKLCRSFFPGCQCHGNAASSELGACHTKRCACFLAARECDRDLCSPFCGASLECPDKCGNFPLQGRQSCHLLASNSGVAGFGIFAAHEIPEGMFVKEYNGESISQEEAERRGVYYDQVNRSYLFNIDSELVIDAFRRGNKIKFANHAGHGKANCMTKIVTVDRTPRICVCSKRIIHAGEELFFDYAYDQVKKGKGIIQNAIVPSWFHTRNNNNSTSHSNQPHAIFQSPKKTKLVDGDSSSSSGSYNNNNEHDDLVGITSTTVVGREDHHNNNGRNSATSSSSSTSSSSLRASAGAVVVVVGS
jgi:hypothetical protein